MTKKLTHKALGLVLIVLMPVIIACSSTAVSASAIYDVSKGLNCVCGCGKILIDCECETAEQLNGIIKKGLARSQPKEEIIQSLVRQYGQRILIE